MASTEEIWKERVLQLVRDEKLGLRVAGLSQLWDEKYPEKYADSKPGPKSAGPKRLVQSKLDGRVVVDRWDYIFECQDGDYLDESEVKELRMQENKDPPKSGYNEDREEWLRICHAFKEALQEDERKPQWSCSYTRLEKGAKELYRCVIQCGLPWEPVPGQHELVGCWAYEYENKKHQFEISQRLEYSEADLDGGMTKGTLTQVFDDNYCNWKVQTEFKNEDEDDWQVGPALALRFGEGKKLQVCGCQVVFCGREIQSNCFDFVAERMTICSFTGYGSEPSESAASAIEVARQDVRMPAARPRVAVQSTPSPSKSKKAVALAPVDDAVSVRFKDATVDLRNLLDSLTALRSAVAAGKPAKSPGAATAATDKGNRESWDVEALGVEDAGRNAYDAMQLFELRDLCTSRGLDAEGDRKQLTMRLEESGWGTRRFEKEQSVRKAYSRVASAPSLPSAKACMRTWHWQGSVEGFSEGDAVECFRDQPWLACSLGAAPGGHSTRGPNPMELASQFPVIRQALASMQASQQKLKDDPELWPAAVSRDKAEEQRRTRRRPPLDARLNTLRHVATGLSFRESPGTLLKRP